MIRGFLTVIFWDVAVELRRPAATLNMSLFALMLLFIGSYGVEVAGADIEEEFGPIFFWTVIVFAGTVGLARAFLLERENAALAGVLVSPLDPGVFYLAKVVSTWLYVSVMEVMALGAYIVFFDFDDLERLPALIAVMAAFTLVYVAIGVVISAMTTSLRGGELVLRILLFPLMIPSIIFALLSSKGTFVPRPEMSAHLSPSLFALGLLAMAAIYLIAGFLLFPKVVEE